MLFHTERAFTMYGSSSTAFGLRTESNRDVETSVFEPSTTAAESVHNVERSRCRIAAESVDNVH